MSPQYDYDGKGEIVILCPTRENVAGARDMVESVYATQHRLATEVVLVVDADDPQLAEYRALPRKITRTVMDYGRPDPCRVMVVEGGSLTKATNEAGARIWGDDVILGHVGDDHHFVTPGWDTYIRDTLLATPGVAYPHDGFSTKWASLWFANAVIPRTLGWFALPGTYHLAIDDAFMDIGAGLGRLTYLNDVLVTHKYLPPERRHEKVRAIVHSHYTAAKREHERAVYMEWLNGGQFDQDIANIANAMGLTDLPVRVPDPGLTFRRALAHTLPNECPHGCCSGMAFRKRSRGDENAPKMWNEGEEPGQKAALAALGAL